MADKIEMDEARKGEAEDLKELLNEEPIKLPVNNTGVDALPDAGSDTGPGMSGAITDTAAEGVGMDFGLAEVEQIEVTSVERDAFINAMVQGVRLHLPFDLYGGKLTGVMRSRKVCETQAVLKEINRRYTDNEYTTQAEYTDALRKSMMMFQLAELAGVKYDSPTGELMAVMDDATGKPTPPEWYAKGEVVISKPIS